jgi:hypothetical protein
MVLWMASSFFGADEVKPLIIDGRTEAEWNNGHMEETTSPFPIN